MTKLMNYMYHPDMDSGQVAVAKGAALGAIRHALPPIRRPSNHWLKKRLHLREAGCHEASPGCPRPGSVWGKYIYTNLCHIYVDQLSNIGQFLTHSRVLMDLQFPPCLPCGAMEQYTMLRGVVHACHAGGVVHCLEGWSHHEVGAIDVDRIDVVWRAAMKHGFTPVWAHSSFSPSFARKKIKTKKKKILSLLCFSYCLLYTTGSPPD